MTQVEHAIKNILEDAVVFNDGDWVESKDQDPDGDVRLIQLADVGDGCYIDKSNRFMTSTKAKALRCTFLEPGDLLVARMPDPLGRCCVFPGDEKPSVTVVDICVIRPSVDKVFPRWLMHCLNAPITRHKIAGYVTGTTRQRISRGNLGKVTIPLPPLSEQKRIAEILDRAEALRAKRRAALALLDELTQSIFLDMFGDPAVNPMGWGTKTLPELILPEKHALKRGPFGGALKKEMFVDSGYLVYEQHHALNNDFSFGRYFITEAKYQKLSAFKVQPNDILISCSGVYLGKLAIVPSGAKPGIINQALLKVSLDQERMKNVFFTYVFGNPQFKKAHFPSSRGVAIPNLPPMKVMKEIGFISPPLELQERFAAIVESVEQQKIQMRSHLAELDNLFASLQYRGFNGEL